MKPMISVIIPVYNVEKYLRRCVNSVLNQTYSNLEIILVDDGSTDNSGAICDELSNEDNRIIVIHQKNAGLSMARNRALDISKGEYIVFVDSDDFIDEEMYESMLKKMQFYDADMVMCSYTKWLEDEKRSVQSNVVCEENVLNKENLFEMSFCAEYSIIIPVAWNKLYKRKLWNDLRYPKGKYHEDEYVIHYLLDKCQRVVLMKESFYNYSIRRNSIMTSRNMKEGRDWIGALLDRKQFYLEHNLEKLFYKQQFFCIRMILWECKKVDNMNHESKQFIREMGKQVKEILKEQHENGEKFIHAKLFASAPVIYIRCNKLIDRLKHIR